jgi:hypothetical protein
MRFAADKMLGRLARWLRVIGQDVVYGPELSGLVLLRVARREGRTVLTRDTRLLRRRELPPHLFIASDHFREQLCQVVAAFDLDARSHLLTRCLDCNAALEEVEPARVRARVPAYVWRTQERFCRCPECHRVFWPATHLDRMRGELESLGLLPVADRQGGK